MKLEELVKRYSAIAREEILKDFRVDSCIASTRITLTVFASFGFKGIAVPCELLAFPRAFMKGDRSESSLPVHIGFHKAGKGPEPEDDPMSPGHVVAYIGKRLMVDASLDQAARPERGISLPSVFCQETRQFLRYGLRGRLFIDDRDVYLEYIPHTKRLTYQHSNDWLIGDRWMPAVLRILHRLPSRMENA